MNMSQSLSNRMGNISDMPDRMPNLPEKMSNMSDGSNDRMSDASDRLSNMSDRLSNMSDRMSNMSDRISNMSGASEQMSDRFFSGAPDPRMSHDPLFDPTLDRLSDGLDRSDIPGRESVPDWSQYLQVNPQVQRSSNTSERSFNGITSLPFVHERNQVNSLGNLFNIR